jgi:hypothetical protein
MHTYDSNVVVISAHLPKNVAKSTPGRYGTIPAKANNMNTVALSTLFLVCITVGSLGALAFSGHPSAPVDTITIVQDAGIPRLPTIVIHGTPAIRAINVAR